MKYIFFFFLFFITLDVTHAQTNPTHITAATESSQEDFKDDWADLHHYQAKNKLLAAPSKGEKRVVFLGSSIFERWTGLMPSFFDNKSYLNRGVSGQIAANPLPAGRHRFET
jgi:hypothetical protein